MAKVEGRGVGNIRHVPELDKYMVGMQVGATVLNEEYSVYFYDASTETVHLIEEQITFGQEGYGTFLDPHPIEIKAGTLYVDEQDGDDTNDGKTWAQAYETIQHAIEKASPGDSIWVAEGTHLPTKDATGNAAPTNNRDKTFFFDKNLHIYGGFTVGDTSLLQRDLINNVSILSGDYNGNDGANFANNGENAYTVVTTENLTNDFRMDGFTVSGGNSNANGGGTEADKNGGGWYNDGIGGSSNPTITNCVFSYNKAATGRAMASYGANSGQSNPGFINCGFHHNVATFDGGAIYNWGDDGEASPEVINCTFSQNSASGSDGVLFNSGNNGGSSSPAIYNSIFWGNTAPSGNSLFNSNANPQLSYSLIEESSCPAGTTCFFGVKYNQNPTFEDAPNGDLRLLAGSPAIDAGLNAALPTGIDYDQNGLLRIFNGGVDLGAYELHDCNIADVMPPNPDCKTTAIDLGSGTGYTLLEGDVFAGGTDDCGAVNFISMSPTSVNCGDVGQSVSVTVAAEDDSGNQNTCTATINVDAAPTGYSCKTTTVQLGANGSYALSENEVFDTGMAGCNAVTFTSMAPTSVDCGDAGTPASITVTAHDGNGNQVNCVATIHVEDTDYPYCPPTHVIYVNANTPNDDDGSSWDNAFVSLQRALELAERCPVATEVWVAAGTYYSDDSPFHTAGDKSETFVLKNNLAIYGGFAGGETDLSERDIESNSSILSGDIGTAGDGNDNSYHLVYNNGGGINATAVLEGLTITAGNADGLGDDGKGAGMFNKSASPTIRHCKFDGNNADIGGGGMYVTNASPTLDTCTFVDNHANVGGGVYNLSLASPSMTGCLFEGNSATDHGGGLFNNNTLLPSVTGCMFDGNTAGQNGGGIHNIGASYAITNSVFLNNTAGEGAAIANQAGADPTIVNCTFSANDGDANGGTVRNMSGTAPTITNCILWGNAAGNSGSVIVDSAPGATVTYSIVEGGHIGTGNLDIDPFFVGTDDLRITPCSPALDVGSDAANTTTVDIINNQRKKGVIDLGAYEMQADLAPPCIWTGNGDGLYWNAPVNWSDLFQPQLCRDVLIPTGHNVTVPAAYEALGRTLEVEAGAELFTDPMGTMNIGN